VLFRSQAEQAGTVQAEQAGTVQAEQAGTVQAEQAGTVQVAQAGTIQVAQAGTIQVKQGKSNYSRNFPNDAAWNFMFDKVPENATFKTIGLVSNDDKLADCRMNIFLEKSFTFPDGRRIRGDCLIELDKTPTSKAIYYLEFSESWSRKIGFRYLKNLLGIQDNYSNKSDKDLEYHFRGIYGPKISRHETTNPFNAWEMLEVFERETTRDDVFRLFDTKSGLEDGEATLLELHKLVNLPKIEKERTGKSNTDVELIKTCMRIIADCPRVTEYWKRWCMVAIDIIYISSKRGGLTEEQRTELLKEPFMKTNFDIATEAGIEKTLTAVTDLIKQGRPNEEVIAIVLTAQKEGSSYLFESVKKPAPDRKKKGGKTLS
jgi:hypothetical protein